MMCREFLAHDVRNGRSDVVSQSGPAGAGILSPGDVADAAAYVPCCESRAADGSALHLFTTARSLTRIARCRRKPEILTVGGTRGR